ncbi:MAG: hypothetical protein PHC88_08930 [Terrimicrobiaceae bacterium]|nr:hypothetical protein [Terrimicrobiaceae bacterium]
MNPTKSLLVAAVVSLAALVVPKAQAAKVDFSAFAGKYKSAYLLQTGGTTLSGNVSVTVTVPGNGRKAAIQIVGFGAISSTPSQLYVLLGNLTLSSKHTVVADNVILAFYAQIPASAHFAGSKNKFTFTLSSNTTIISNAAIAYTLTFSGKHLSIVGSGTLGVNPVSVSLTGTRQGR